MERHRFASWPSPPSTLMICAALAAGAVGCGDQDATCTLGSSEGCESGQVCEEVVDGEPACFAPVFVEGRVFDAQDESGIEGATVVAIDANGAPRSTVVTSGADGAYSLPVPAPRDADGAPISDQITLRADASGYQTFPTAPRQGIPIDLATAADVDEDGDSEVANASTDIALFARDDVPAGAAIVRGSIQGGGAGVLVVAVQGERGVASAISDTEGGFVLFDVPAVSTSVEGYAAGVRITPATITPAAPETTGVVLTAAADGLATVSGSVQIVNAPSVSETSVILVLESTFVETVARGESPPGLRVGEVGGAWSIEGVAPGDYVALAAFENDRAVRDPDTSIGGTQIVHFTVDASGTDVEIGEGFKVTEALEIVGPGADTIETITDATPTFEWADDSSEEGYEIRVYDAFGVQIHEDLGLPSVSGSGTVTYDYPGTPALEPGMVYQFRVWSYSIDMDGAHVYKSVTEDLRGVFLFEP